jgi:hypothetical protein
MRTLIITLPFLFFLTWGCQKAEPVQQDFPLLEVLPPTDVSQAGATLRGRLLKDGALPITKIGFSLKPIDPSVTPAINPFDDQTITYFLQDVPAKGEFEFRLETFLVENVVYEIRVVAHLDNLKTFSEPIEFTSQGSLDSEWRIIAKDTEMPPFNYPHVVASAGDLYLVSNTGHTYVFNPTDLSLIRITGQQFPSLNLESFFLVEHNGEIYRAINGELFQLEEDRWNTINEELPYTALENACVGFFHNDQLFTVNQAGVYSYDFGNDTWTDKADYPDLPNELLAGVYYDGLAYLLSADKIIWTYDPNLDTWSQFSQLPGNELLDGSYSGSAFVLDGTLRFGLLWSRTNYTTRNIYSYDFGSQMWGGSYFPVMTNDPKAACTIGDKAYIFQENQKGLVDLWEFAPN